MNVSQKNTHEAQAILTSIMRKSTQQAMAQLDAIMDGAHDEIGVAKALGVDVDFNDPVQVELLAPSLGLIHSRKMLELAIPMAVEQLAQAELGPGPVVRIERTAEAVLAQQFKRIDTTVLNKALGQPGAIESVVDEIQTFSLNMFPDGSVIAINDRHGNPNAKLSDAFFDQATKIEQMNQQSGPENLAKARESTRQMIEDVERETNLSSAARERLPAVLEQGQLDTARSLDQMAKICAHHEHAAEFVETLATFKEGDAWAPGVAVTLDGRPCPTPADLSREFGIASPITLESAMDRLRQSRASRSEPGEPAIKVPGA